MSNKSVQVTFLQVDSSKVIYKNSRLQVSHEIGALESFENSLDNSCAGVHFLVCNFIKKEILAQSFSNVARF